MSTLKTHNLQSPDAGSVNIALAPNAGMVVTGISTFTGAIDANGDLDVDGHTELDNINISGVSTHVGLSQFQNTINLTHASAGQNYIYFTEDLQFAKNGTGTQLKIDSSGKLLVGKTSGTAKVDIDASNSTLRLTKANDSDYVGFQLDRNNSGTAGGYLGLSGASGHYATTAAQHDLVLRSQSNLLFATNGDQERLRITTTGQVGIGTNAPASNMNLHVLDQTDRCYVTFESGGNESSQLWLKNPARTWKISNYYDQNALTFTDDSDERLRITNDGRILLNTTSTTNTDDFLTIKRPAGGHSLTSMTVDATTATGSYANAFIITKSKGYYYNGLIFSSSDKHEGGIVGRTGGSGNDPSIEVRVGGTGLNASDTLAMNINHSGYVTKPAHPSFHARLINHKNATQNPLVFDDVIVNVGSHYKSSGSDAGKFVVPIAGTYFFFWEAIKNATTNVTRLYLNKNGSKTYNSMHLRLQEEGLYANGCMNAIMTLAVGDKIHIELSVGGVHASEYTHFGGYLIG